MIDTGFWVPSDNLNLGLVEIPDLPKGCIFTETKNITKKHFSISYLIEIPPGLKSISFRDVFESEDGDYERGNIKHFILAMPWQYFWLEFIKFETFAPTINLMGLYWSKEKLKTIEDRVSPAELSNIDEEIGSICMGKLCQSIKGTVVEQANQFPSVFFESIFNDDMGGPGGSDYDTWQTSSELNPEMWKTMGWYSSNPLSYYIQELKDNE